MKLLTHVPDMLAYRRSATSADVVHFQWLPVQWLDVHLLPRRPLVLTAHDLLPREARPGQARAQRRLYDAVDAVVVHSTYGASMLSDRLGVDAEKVHVIAHGAFSHLAAQPASPLPAGLAQVDQPVALFFGLLRPYKGLDLLLEAWRGIADAELWIVGRPRMSLASLKSSAPGKVRFIDRFVSDQELAAYFRRAELVVLPYLDTGRFDQSGVLATALAFGKPMVLSDVGGFGDMAREGAAAVFPAGDAAGLRSTILELLGDSVARERMARAAQALADGPYSWEQSARETLRLYESLAG
jgi:glycosyltransferase involved in cell wall biosynthesis